MASITNVFVRNSEVDDERSIYATYIEFTYDNMSKRVLTGIYAISPHHETILSMSDTTGLSVDISSVLLWWPPADNHNFTLVEFIEACARCGWPDEKIKSLRAQLIGDQLKEEVEKFAKLSQ